ncbi:MAG: ATP-binding protein [Candidatus Eisenbacteria bacterium]
MPLATDPLAAGTLEFLHLTEYESDSELLGAELRDCGVMGVVTHAATGAELQSALEGTRFDVLVVDLPLPDSLDASLLDELATRRPELSILFRWGSTGQWSSEAPGEQLRRSLANAMAARIDRDRSRAEGRHVLTQVVRQQQSYLQLSRLDLWDFDRALHTMTAEVSRLLGVARVSVWELSPDDAALDCLDLYDARTGQHTRAPRLTSFPTYLASLRRSLTLTVHDAHSDPRTAEFLAGYLEPLGISALLDAPVQSGGRVIGVLCLEHVGAEPRQWTLLDQCAAGATASMVARAFEVRTRRRLEERMARSERLQTLGQLASGVAHDLKNVLTVLIGNLDLAANPKASPETSAQHLQVARDAAKNVHQLVNDLLMVGRSGELHLQSLELRGHLDRSLAFLRAALPERVRLEMGPSVPGPVRVMADVHALSRVLLNLVRNAADAIPAEGRVTLSLKLGDACEGGDDLPPGPAALLTIEDTGVGMDESTQRHLFEPFHSTKPAGVGHGLGLATSYGLVRQLGGTIRAESTLGRGSRFTIVLPIHEV